MSVVVDSFSMAAHFGMLPSYYSAFSVAELFFIMLSKLHRLPTALSQIETLYLQFYFGNPSLS